MALLGLDIGTTGAKATIFDFAGNILAYTYNEYDIISERPGCYEINPLTVWDKVKVIISKVYKAAGNVKIEALSTSSFGEAFIMLDRQGKEISNSPIYMDERGEIECSDLVNTLGAKWIMGITGHPPHSMYSVCKLMWQCNNNRELYKKVSRILFFGDYILHKLGGQYVSDYSLAARSMCFDISKKRWSEKIIEAAGLDIDIFPEINSTGSVVGEILPNIADELGINSGIRLVLGGHDQIMVALGAGVTKENQAVNGIGTVDCITPVFKGTKLDRKMLKCSYASIPYLFENSYVTYAFNMTGGSLLKWFRDTFARKDKEIATKYNQEIYDILGNEMPKEPTNMFVLPHFAGAPVPNPDICAKGAIINLSLGSTRGEIYKACMEGEAFEMRHNIDALDSNGIAIKELRTVGGGSRSDEWMKIRADVFNREVCTMKCEEAGTLGTAILAGVAAGCYSSLDEAANALSQIKKRYYPDSERNKVYNDRYEKYKQLYDLLKPVR